MISLFYSTSDFNPHTILRQMGGNFPTLGASASNKSNNKAAGAWGKSASTSSTDKRVTTASGAESDVWGRGSKPSGIASTGIASTGDGANISAGTGAKKEKKTKVVIMSNK